MIQFVSLHTEAACKALRQLLRQPVATLLILVMLAIAMTLPLALYLGVQSGQQVLGQINDAPTMTLYMQMEAKASDNQAVEKALRANKQLEKVVFVSKQQGLEELQQSMGSQDLVSMLDSNPLPDAFTVTPQVDTPEELAALQTQLAKLPMVESVKMDAEWMQTLYQINHFVHQLLWFLAITLGLAFALVAYNTIRLQILSHREEIEITKLLGAPASFIRRPFLYLSIWQSLLAAAISIGLCFWLCYMTQPIVSAILQPYGVHITWRFFNSCEIVVILLLVCGLGVVGAWLATRQHLLSFKSVR